MASSLHAQADKTIATIKMSGQRLLQLINDILDAAKMKQGSLVIKHQEVGNPWRDYCFNQVCINDFGSNLEDQIF